MVDNLIRLTEMIAENRWCINRAKDYTVFEKDEKEYCIMEVKNYAVKLINIDTMKYTDWINVQDFQNRYKETEFCIICN